MLATNTSKGQIMTDELQSGSIDSDESLVAENLDSNEQGAELAPDSETQHEQQAGADVNQKAIQKAINKQHKMYREEERKRIELENELKSYREKEQQAQAQQFSAMPAKPDPFDDDYDEKFAKWESAIKQKAEYDAQQNFLEQQRLQQQQQEQARIAADNQKKAESYANNAKNFGITSDELVSISQTLVSGGLQDENLALALLEDPEGALVAKYLSANLTELDELQNANPYLAASKMAEIKQKAQALKPKTSKTPPPADRVDQRAVDPEAGALKHAKGGSFE